MSKNFIKTGGRIPNFENKGTKAKRRLKSESIIIKKAIIAESTTLTRKIILI